MAGPRGPLDDGVGWRDVGSQRHLMWFTPPLSFTSLASQGQVLGTGPANDLHDRTLTRAVMPVNKTYDRLLRRATVVDPLFSAHLVAGLSKNSARRPLSSLAVKANLQRSRTRTELGSALQPRIVAETTGRATVRVAFFRASNRSRALRITGQFDCSQETRPSTGSVNPLPSGVSSYSTRGGTSA